MARTVQTFIMGIALAFVGATAACSTYGSSAESRSELTGDSTRALQDLSAANPAAAAISGEAVAVLVFPNIVKAGLGLGGAYGEGELRQNGASLGRYKSFTGSWGLQAGAQSYGYAVFLMNQDALNYLEQSDGWEIGVGPTVVLMDEGTAKNFSTTTFSDDAYAFIFDQQGLMAGLSIEGTKITRMD